jgi:tetrathionate reductase subunit B
LDRRDFLRKCALLLAGATGAWGTPLLLPSLTHTAARKTSSARRKWGMVIDVNKCPPDCSACVEACRQENNVALHGDKRWDIYWIRKVTVKRKNSASSIEKSVPLLCNQCDNPPCVKICPVKASYQREDGIVLVDPHRCIGCRYCLMACPYNERFFNFKENTQWPNKDYPIREHGVSESCNFCAHLVDKGERPACVVACERAKHGAMIFGNLNDPGSDVSRVLAASFARGIREDLGTKPKVYYIGL